MSIYDALGRAHRAEKRITELEAERTALLAENAAMREALEKVDPVLKAIDSDSYEYIPPAGFYEAQQAIDAALAKPATDAALERVRREAANAEAHHWLTLIQSIDPERLCDVHDSLGIEEYLRAWMRGVKADALEEWADTEEVLDGDPPEDVISYFRDKQAAVECLRAAVRATLTSANRKAAALRGGE